MSTPILITKLYIPPPRPDLIHRRRLLQRLNAGLHRKLTLISAPAGFGKTTLISSWIDGLRAEEASQESTQDRPSTTTYRVAWLSLDEQDSDPVRFLTYFVAALQKIDLVLGSGVLDRLQSPQPPPIEPLLTTLLNQVATLQDNVMLVLDDYHGIEDKVIDDALAFLLDHLPPQMHLVITTRADPQLPLARYRARGQLSELRAGDLRFTPAEAADFLERVTGVTLDAEAIAALERRTEGWIAGLQLAALALQGMLSTRGQQDVSDFIRAFAGDNRYIVDYLVEEVLQSQPRPVRTFLLQTSILDRLCGPLCDAVCFGNAATQKGAEGAAFTGREKGTDLLAQLECRNLFVVPLDDKRQWYRYHHLFADVLKMHLKAEHPDKIQLLHRRASAWYADNDMPDEAIAHAFAARTFERAADLVELAWRRMDSSRQSARWLKWAQALPDDVVRTRPVLNAGYGWALLDGGDPEAGEARLHDAERWLDGVEGNHARAHPFHGEPRTRRPASEIDVGQMTVVDEEEFRSLAATIASARAYHAQTLGDVLCAITYARRALDLLPEEDFFRRGVPAAILGLALWTRGDLETAYDSLAHALASFEKSGHSMFAIIGTYILADIRVVQGRLYEAVRVYEKSLQRATDLGDWVLQATADQFLGLSELHCEQGNLKAATQHLQRCKAWGADAGISRWPFRWRLARARIQAAQGDLDGANGLLEESERLYIRGPVPELRPIAALKARLWIRQGRIGDALEWVRAQRLSVDDNLSYLREFEHITLARVLMAQWQNDRAEGSLDEAMGLLERLLNAAEAGGRTGSVIEILVLQALAHHALGDLPAALVPLQRALALAEPQGYVSLFVDEGLPMAALLSQTVARGMTPAYSSRLLERFELDSAHSAGGRDHAATPAAQPLIEPLSERELEVLQLLAQGLTNQEIGERLFLALSTVKGHNRNIYAKMQVRRRTEAVARARALDLLAN